MMQKTIGQYFGPNCSLRVTQTNHNILNLLNGYSTTFPGLYNCCACLHKSAITCTQNVGDGEKRTALLKDETKHKSQWWVTYFKSLSFKERCVSRISKSLQCSEHEAKLLIDVDELTFLDKIDSTVEKIECLLDRDITPESIRTNIAVLRLSCDDLKTRMDCMGKWQIRKSHYSSFLPMFRLPTMYFLLVSDHFIAEKDLIVPDGNRIIYLAKQLECSVHDMNRRVLKCHSLYIHDFEEIKSTLECYRKFGVKNKHILDDISGLECDVGSIQKRLSGLHGMGFYPLTPELVLLNDQSYNRRLKELEQETNYYSPYKNRDEYLNAKLFLNKNHISQERKAEVISFFEYIDAKRLTSIMEFLLEKKFTLNHLIKNRIVFAFEVVTLKERYEVLREVGVQNPPLRSLLLKEDNFEEFVKRAKFNRSEQKDIIHEMSHLISSSKPVFQSDDTPTVYSANIVHKRHSTKPDK